MFNFRQKKKQLKTGLELKIVAALTLVMFIFGGITVWQLYRYSKQYEINKEKHRLEEIVNVKGGILQRYFQQMSNVVNELAVDEHVRGLLKGRHEYDAVLHHFGLLNVNHMFLSIYVMDSQGEVLASLDKRFEGKNYGFRDYFKEAMQGKPYFDVAVGVTSGQLGYYISRPVKDKNGQVIGVIVGKVNPGFVQTLLRDMARVQQNGLEEILIDKDGVIVGASDSKLLFKTISEIDKNKRLDLRHKKFPNLALESSGYTSLLVAIENNINSGYFKDDYGKGWYYQIYPFETTGMFLTALMSEEYILAGVLESVKIVFAVVAIAVLATDLIVGMWIMRYMKQIDKLALAAKNIAEGKFNNPLNWKSNDQLGELVVALRKMQSRLKRWHQDLTREVEEKTKKLRERMVELEKAKLDLEKFKLAVDNVGEQIVITDPDGIVIYANKALKTITGFDPQEVVGHKVGTKDLWGGLMGKNFYRDFWKTIKTKKKMFIGEFRNKRRNGQEYIAAANVAPVLNKKGEVIYFVGIERDITKEKEIDQMKTDFISLASHQLRTPLSAMRWFLEMLLNGDMGKLTKKQREVVKDIEESNDRMIELVNGLLNISRIESGRIIVEPEMVDLKELVEDVVKDLEEYIRSKKQTVVVSVHPDLPKIKLDPKLIRQVYLNLISNAVKYTPEGGEINVFVSKKGKEIVSQISDNGFGIPKEEQDKIFKRFFRASNVVKKEVGGTGLGLYLARAVVESSGGKIWFKSQEGKGTTFWFTLPMKGMKKKKGEVRLT